MERVVRGDPIKIPIPDVSTGQWMYSIVARCAKNKLTAFIDETTKETLSYDELLKASKKVAESLEDAGIAQSDVVAICSDNNIHIFTVVLGALYAGIPVTSINPSYLEHEIIHAINLTEPKIVFCSRSVCEKFVQLKATGKFNGEIVVFDTRERVPETFSLDGFTSKYSKGSREGYRPRPVDAVEHVAFILFSSGTTGLPKGVMTTHRNVNARLCYELDPDIYYHSPNSPYIVCVLPLFHAYGLQVGLGCLLMGQTMVVLKRFEPEPFLRALEKYKVGNLHSVPTLMRFLAKSPLVDKFDLSSLEEVTYGSAPAGAELEIALAKRLNAIVRQGYGLTEVTLGVIANPVGHVKPGSVGKLYPGMECVVRDPETGRDVGPYEHGELCFKGENVMRGYYRNPQATRDTFTSDGYLRTGDIGYYDNDEYFYVVDRLKELIKYKGFQVAPTELEAVLMQHPKVADAAVIGLPDEYAGELPAAIVVKVPGVDLSEVDVKNWIAAHLSKNKHLHGGVFFVDVLPRNSTGKVSRKDVKKLANTLISKL